jgi:hypothetical protein
MRFFFINVYKIKNAFMAYISFLNKKANPEPILRNSIRPFRDLP